MNKINKLKMNTKEKKILYSLTKNCRKSASLLAKSCGVSKEKVLYTIKKFIEQKLIKKFVTLINTESLGYQRNELFLRMNTTQSKIEFIEYAKKHMFFMWIRESLGDYDILTEFYSKDIQHYDRIINEIRSEFSRKILYIETATVINETSFPLKPLDLSIQENEKKMEIKKVEVDKTDKLILYHLADDARTNVTNISPAVSLSPDAVIYRMKKMLRAGLIYGYRIVVDESMVGLEKYKLLLRFDSTNSKKFRLFLGFLGAEPTTQYIKRCIGKWDLSITLVVSDPSEVYRLMDKIREYVGDSLTDYKVLLLFKEHKNTYFPEGITI